MHASHPVYRFYSRVVVFLACIYFIYRVFVVSFLFCCISASVFRFSSFHECALSLTLSLGAVGRSLARCGSRAPQRLIQLLHSFRIVCSLLTAVVAVAAAAFSALLCVYIVHTSQGERESEGTHRVSQSVLCVSLTERHILNMI